MKKTSLQTTTWLLGTSIVSMAAMLAVTYVQTRSPGAWVLSFLTAQFLLLAVMDSREELRGKAACAGFLILELLCAWQLFSLPIFYCLVDVHLLSILTFQIVKKYRPTRQKDGLVRVRPGIIRAILYNGGLFLGYGCLGLYGGQIALWMMTALMAGGLALLAAGLAFRNWGIRVAGEEWTVLHRGKERNYSFSEITKVRRIPALGYLIEVNHRPVCLFQLTMENTAVFWMNIRSKVE